MLWVREIRGQWLWAVMWGDSSRRVECVTRGVSLGAVYTLSMHEGMKVSPTLATKVWSWVLGV